jgi:hypothetical protein
MATDNPTVPDPTPVDNSGANGPGTTSPPTPTPGAGSTGQVSLDDFRRMQQELDGLKSLSDRYKQQNDGSRQEIQRLQTDIDRRVQEGVSRAQAEWQARMASAMGVGQDPSADSRPISRKDAMDAYYLRGDETLMERYEQQQLERQRQAAREEYVNVSLPGAFANTIRERHKDVLGNANSEEYREVIETYNQLAVDPMTRHLVGENPAAVVEMWMPGASEKRSIDLRLLNEAAYQVKLTRAHTSGRTAEASRRDAPEVAGAMPGTPDGSSMEPGPESLMTAQEKDGVASLFASRAVPLHLPEAARKSQAGYLRWWVDRLKKDRPSEYQQRLEMLRRSGGVNA